MGLRPSVLIGFLLFLIYFGLAVRFPLHGVLQDDGLYVQLGESLLEGRYEVAQLPSSPTSVRNPPAFPALLAVVHAFGGDWEKTPWAFCIPGALLTALSVVLWFQWLARRRSRLESLIVAGLFALAPGVLLFTQTAMSEPVAFAAVPAVLLLMEALPRRSALLGIGAILGFTLMARPIIAPAALVVGICVWLRFGWRQAATYALPIAIPCAAWLLHMRTASPSPYRLFDYYLSYGGVLSLDLIQTVPAFFKDLVHGTTAQLFGVLWFPEFELGASEFVRKIRTALALLLTVVTLALAHRRRYHDSAMAQWFFAAGVLICVANSYSIWRYVLPYLPIFILAHADVMCFVLRRSWMRRALTGLMIASALTGVAAQAQFGSGCRLWTSVVDDKELHAEAAWIREHSNPSDILITDYDAWFYRVTGRRSVMVEPALTTEQRRSTDLVALARQRFPGLVADYKALSVSYVLTNPFLDPSAGALMHLLESASMTREVYRGRTPAYRILRFVPLPR